MSRAVLTVNNAAHQVQHAAWMKAGLERHGWQVELVQRNGMLGAAFDMVGCWSVKQPRVWDWQKKHGGPVLVMERAALQPRHTFTSVGFDGLAGRGRYPQVDDGGTRWRKHFAQHMKPWREGGDYVLLCGQVRGDAAIWGCDFHAWAQQVTSTLKLRGKRVRYRPHPLSLKFYDRWNPFGAEFSTRPYEEDLAGAELVVTFNSTSGVEAVLAGVPAVTFDKGAMAWDVTTHDLDTPPARPDREQWAHRLAFSCWLPQEIESGEAWDYVKEAMPCLV